GNSSTRQWEHFFTSSGEIALAVGTILHYQWELLLAVGTHHWKWEKCTRIDTPQKSVVSLSDTSAKKAFQVAKDPSCSQTPLNGEHERVAPIYQSSITEFVYLIEAHHHLNPIFIPKDNSPRRLDDGVVMLVLEARGHPLRFGEVHLSLVALNPKLEVFYALSYNQLSGPLVDGHSENLLVCSFFIIAVQTPGSGISILLAVGTPSTGSGNLYFQWELSPSSENALCILFPTLWIMSGRKFSL
nr:hypothetical protein [Tanacetum cinerariifolium]